MTQGLPKPKTWEDEYLISFYEVDAKNRVFLPSLWKYLQETEDVMGSDQDNYLSLWIDCEEKMLILGLEWQF